MKYAKCYLDNYVITKVKLYNRTSFKKSDIFAVQLLTSSFIEQAIL